MTRAELDRVLRKCAMRERIDWERVSWNVPEPGTVKVLVQEGDTELCGMLACALFLELPVFVHADVVPS